VDEGDRGRDQVRPPSREKRTEAEAEGEARDAAAEARDAAAEARDAAAEARDAAAESREDDSAGRLDRSLAARDRGDAARDRRLSAEERALALEREAAAGALAAAGQDIQRILLPTLPSDLPVGVVYRPGDERLLLGGDFYDCLRLPSGEIAFVLGDVAGHGPAEAGLGVAMRLAWRALAMAGLGVPDLLPVMERALGAEITKAQRFVTMLVGETVRGGQVRFCCAGHPAPILIEAHPRELPCEHGPPLGLPWGSDGWQAALVRLTPGQSLLLYTDGLTETRAARRHGAGEDTLLRVLSAIRLHEDRRRLRQVVDRVREIGEGFPDDVAAMVVGPFPG
jgi:serine phosphatase RsbU (regulator of sigma subunit)